VKTVSTSGNNTCTSLTGVKIATKTDYRYPSEPNVWQLLCYDFELTTEQQVQVSLGFQTSASAGAANNTLLYLDHVRLLRQGGSAQGVRDDVLQSRLPLSVTCDLQGRRLSRVSHPGVYIREGRKLLIR
jgi:hypothetical protein